MNQAELEQRVLDAAAAGDRVEFLSLAAQLGSLERAQQLVRSRGVRTRPGGSARVRPSHPRSVNVASPPARAGSATLPISVTIRPHALRQIRRELADHGDGREVGGALLGYALGSMIVVTDAGGVDWLGRTTERTPHSIRIDVAKAIALERKANGSGSRWLGDWHSHEGNASPSGADVRSWIGLSESRVSTWIGLIVAPGSAGTWRWVDAPPRLTAYVVQRGPDGQAVCEPARIT